MRLAFAVKAFPHSLQIGFYPDRNLSWIRSIDFTVKAFPDSVQTKFHSCMTPFKDSETILCSKDFPSLGADITFLSCMTPVIVSLDIAVKALRHALQIKGFFL